MNYPVHLSKLVPDYRRCVKLKDRGLILPSVLIYAWDNSSPAHKPFLTTRTRAFQLTGKPETWTVLCSAPTLPELVEWAAENKMDAWRDFWNNQSTNVDDFADIIIRNLGG